MANQETKPGSLLEVWAKQVGWSASTLERATEICDAAEADPEHFADLRTVMDKTNNVEKVYGEFLVRKAKLEKKKFKFSEAFIDLVNLPGLRMPPFMVKAFEYIPEENQTSLVKDYHKYIFMVQKVHYDRAVKSYSRGRGISSLTEDTIHKCLKDVLQTTMEIDSLWVFQDHTEKSLTIKDSIIHARGSARPQDKEEWLLVDTSMNLTALAFQLEKSYIDGYEGADHQHLLLVEKFLTLTLGFHDTGFFAKIAAMVRQELGAPEEIAREERQVTNAMVANENLEEIQGSLSSSLIHIRRHLKKLADDMATQNGETGGD